jgi:medium-chain acyl-[acyl-carrier-protein] hydrolase
VLELFVPTVRADYELVETYRYTEEPPLPCPITTLAGLADPETVQERLELWERHTAAGFSLSLFPGDHFFLHGHPEVLPTLLRTFGLEGPSPS